MPQFRVAGASPAGANLVIDTVGFSSEVSYQKQAGEANPNQSPPGKMNVKGQEEQIQRTSGEIGV